MPRPLKSNALYFSHDAHMRNNRKVKALRSKFGPAGYGLFCMILESLTNSSGFMMEFNAKEIELIAGDFGTGVPLLKKVVAYLIEIGILEKRGESIMSPELNTLMEPLLRKRERQREYYKSSGKNDINDILNEEGYTPEIISKTEESINRENLRTVNNLRSYVKAAAENIKKMEDLRLSSMTEKEYKDFIQKKFTNMYLGRVINHYSGRGSIRTAPGCFVVRADREVFYKILNSNRDNPDFLKK